MLRGRLFNELINENSDTMTQETLWKIMGRHLGELGEPLRGGGIEEKVAYAQVQYVLAYIQYVLAYSMYWRTVCTGVQYVLASIQENDLNIGGNFNEYSNRSAIFIFCCMIKKTLEIVQFMSTRPAILQVIDNKRGL